MHQSSLARSQMSLLVFFNSLMICIHSLSVQVDPIKKLDSSGTNKDELHLPTPPPPHHKETKKKKKKDLWTSVLLEEIVKSNNLHIFLSNLLDICSSEITSHNTISQLYSDIFIQLVTRLQVRLQNMG